MSKYCITYFLGGGSMPNIQAKQQVVNELSEKFNERESAVLVDYRGVTVEEVTALREELRDNDIDYIVYKNTLARRPIEVSDVEGLHDKLLGPDAIGIGK